MKKFKSFFGIGVVVASFAASVLSIGASAISNTEEDSFNLTEVNSTGCTVFMFNCKGNYTNGTVTLTENTKGKKMRVDAYRSYKNEHQLLDIKKVGTYTIWNSSPVPSYYNVVYSWDAQTYSGKTKIKGAWKFTLEQD